VIGLERYHHLLACGEDHTGLFLQLAIYAERAGKLDEKAQNEASERFVKKFRYAVRRLPCWCQQEGESARSLLLKAWEKIKKTYRIPTTHDDFSHYARRMIGIVKKDPRAQHEVLAESVGIDLDNVRIGADVLRKRKGEKRWTSRGLEDQKEEYYLKEAAALVGMGKRTFYKLVERGRIPVQRDSRASTVLPGWETKACQWKEQEQERLRKSGLRKIFALAWEKRQGLPSPNAFTKKKMKKINQSAVTQIKRWRAAGMAEGEIKKKIGEENLRWAIERADQYLTEQELEAIGCSPILS
jgi:hypothetical protein